MKSLKKLANRIFVEGLAGMAHGLFAAAPNSFATRHLVVIVYGVDYQGI